MDLATLLPKRIIGHLAEHDDFSEIWLMEENGLGKVRIYWFHDELNKCYIEGLHVSDDFRNLGIGTLLLNCCVAIVKQLGAKYLLLWCYVNDWPIRWYRKLGWYWNGKHKEYDNAVWMIRNLD